MRKINVRLLRRLRRESAARMRRRIKIEATLGRLFYEGENPLRINAEERCQDVTEYTDEHELQNITGIVRASAFFVYA